MSEEDVGVAKEAIALCFPCFAIAFSKSVGSINLKIRYKLRFIEQPTDAMGVPPRTHIQVIGTA